MADYSIKILNLCPDLLNLSGDTGNVSVLKMRCQKRCINAVCCDFVSSGEFLVKNTDIVLIGGGGEKEVLKALDILLPHADKIKEFAENGGVLLATHTGYQMLLKTFEMGGKTYTGLGILDAESFETDGSFMGDFALESELDGKAVILAGFENHKNKTKSDNFSPLGKVLFGRGDKGEYEGIFYKNVIGTYMCGPILPKNPELADFLIKKAILNKYPNFKEDLKELCDDFEAQAKQFIINRNKK